MASDFYAFLLALLPYWWVFLTSGPAALDRVFRNHSATYAAWADKKWDAKARARLFRRTALAGIFVAGFLAFRDEHHHLLSAQRTIDQVDGKRERTYPAAYFDSTTNLYDKLSSLLAMHPYGWIYIGYVDNPSSVKLAQSFLKGFKRPSTRVLFAPAPEDDPNGQGLTLLIHDSSNPTDEDKKITDAFRSSGLLVKLSEMNKDQEFAQEVFGIYISYPHY